MVSEADEHYAVELHADDAGRSEYAERRHDVEVCGSDERYAWPYVEAHLVFIAARGIPLICNQIGIREEAWIDWYHVWRSAFQHGYEMAHAAHVRDNPTTGAR